MDLLARWLIEALDLFRLMAPYLLLGFLLAGILHALVPRVWVARHLGGRGMASAIKAAVVGTPLPLCSCGVIPFADLLKRQGASRPAITSFLISTPQTGVDSILASYAVLGLPLALWKVVTALVSGVIGGTINGWLSRGEEDPGRESQQRGDTQQRFGSPPVAAEACAVGPPASGAVGAGAAMGGTSDAPPVPRAWMLRVRSIFSYGLGMLVEEVALWLVIGVVIGGAIAAFVPDDFLAQNFPNPYLQMIAVLAVAVPLYVCATGSVPVAAALVMKGMPLGAAIVFLIAGPATNVATLTVFTKVLGRRTVAVYLATIVVVSYAFGLLFGVFFPGATLPPMVHEHGAHGEGVGPLARMAWWEWAASLLLMGLLLRAFVVKLRLRYALRGRARVAMEDTEMETVRLNVTGMNCGHCQSSVERALRGVQGVVDVEVSLDTESATVSGEELEVEALVEAVRSSGFQASRAQA